MAEEATKTRILRDPTFSRHTADVGFAYDLGRDLDLTFLVTGPELFAEPEEDSGVSGVTAITNRSEVCRIRMRPSAAAALAVDTLNEVVSNRRLKTPKLKKDIEKILLMISEIESTSSGESEHELSSS